MWLAKMIYIYFKFDFIVDIVTPCTDNIYSVVRLIDYIVIVYILYRLFFISFDIWFMSDVVESANGDHHEFNSHN